MKQLYLKLFETLLSIPAPVADEVSDRLVKHADRYNAQPEFMDDGVPFHLPAVFVEVGRVAWQTLPGGVQRGEALVRLHVVQLTAADSYMNAYGGSENREKAMEAVDALDLLHAHVQGLAVNTPFLCCTGLDRTGTLSDTRHDIVSVDILEYRTLITQEQASPQQLYATITGFDPVLGELDIPGPPVAGDAEDDPQPL